MLRRTKIVCTLGPSSGSQEQILALVKAGMDCARLNFSHGTHADHKRVAEHVRAASLSEGRPVAILCDLCGPKIRIGKFKTGSVELEDGTYFTLTTRPIEGDVQMVSVSHKGLPRDVTSGDEVLLDDGLLKLRVVKVSNDEDVLCKVEVGGTLSDRKGLNLPGTKLSIPSLTEKDRSDLEFATRVLEVDYVALSFVRSPKDVELVRSMSADTPVISKIEKPEAIENLEAIIEASDGVMVARGDLGVELGSEKMPLIQKRIIRESNRRGKLVITATQMLDSMIRNPRPTRAEVTDVANAVLDGTSAVMLSGETASGKYPLEAVEMMSAIVKEVELDWMRSRRTSPVDTNALEENEWRFPTAAAKAAALLTFVLPLKAVVVFTGDGSSARFMSEHRPKSPILAVCHREEVARKLALEWGVFPRVEVAPADIEETLRIASGTLVREGFCKTGDAFAMVVGWPLSERTNTVKLHKL